MEWREFRFRRRTDCAVCGDAPTIITLADSAASCASDAPARWPRVNAEELRQLLGGASSEAEAAPTIVDVREVHEFQAGHLDGSVNIPLGELSRRIGELSAQAPVVFVCRSGRRSQTACELSARAGVQRVADLEGGLLAWAATVDSSIKVA
jgi:sulfur-carrier protein adenylyltransferase/sulfurtransferase